MIYGHPCNYRHLNFLRSHFLYIHNFANKVQPFNQANDLPWVQFMDLKLWYYYGSNENIVYALIRIINLRLKIFFFWLHIVLFIKPIKMLYNFELCVCD